MKLRNKTGEFREEKFFEQHYEMPTIIIKITIVLYSIIGLGAVGITLKNESTKIFDEITSAKTIVIEFTEKVEDGNTGIKRDEVGSNKKNNSITAITCYDYAEVYAEKYQVNADLLKRIIEAESNGNEKAENKVSTASGCAQFIIGSWRNYGKLLWDDEFYQKNVYSPKDNVELMSWVISKRGTKDWNASKSKWSK